MARLVQLFCMILLPACTLFGQTFTGSVSGIVTDASDAVLPATAVTVTDIERNTHSRAATNETGFYVVSSLPPGNYRVTAEKPGFRVYVLEPLVITTHSTSHSRRD